MSYIFLTSQLPFEMSQMVIIVKMMVTVI